MQDDQSTRFILMAAAGLLVCVLLFILAWSRLISPTAQTEDLTLSGERFQGNQQQIVPIQGEGVIEVATSSVKTQQLQDILNSWQEDTVIATGTSAAEFVPAASEPEPEPIEPLTNEERFPAADLSGLGFDSQSQVSVGTGGPLPTGLPTSVGPTTESAAELETLPDSSARNCGSLTVPSSAFGLAFFSAGLSSDPGIVCMGEAVADDCDTRSLSASSDDGLDGLAYVASGSDGRCGVGFRATTDDTLMLCDLETILERDGDQDFPWSVWESRFAAEPGPQMASLISSNFDMLTNPAAIDNLGCVAYALE